MVGSTPVSARVSMSLVPHAILEETSASQVPSELLSARGGGRSRVASGVGDRSSTGDAANRADVEGTEGATPRGGQMSRRDFELRKKKAEARAKHEKLREARDRDARAIRERATRVVAERDRRFEEMLESLRQEEILRDEAAQVIQQHDNVLDRKRWELHKKWNDEVYERVDRQVGQFFQKRPPLLGEDGRREGLLATDCPIRRPLIEQQREEAFNREADAFCGPEAFAEIAQVGSQEHARRREDRMAVVSARATSRPVLPINAWAQSQHHSSRFGYFEQSCVRQNEGNGFRSARRMGEGAHRVDQSDGVVAAGTGKHRHERFVVRMLEGSLAKEGESARYKYAHGGGSAAPCQDHFNYEVGNSIVDEEFPIGKRTYPHLLR